MSGISSVSRISYNDYGRFASGRRVQNAADGAAELSIIQKQDAQARGYDVGARNIGTAKDMMNVADGAMSGITDYLQRIRELAVQASNSAIYGSDDLDSIQMEVDQLKQGISDIASQTQFNGMNLLDGSRTNLNVATDANGTGMQVNIGDSTLAALGIANFDVTGNFDIGAIDRALEKLGATRSNVGAQTNSLEFTYNYNTNTSLNTTAAKSRLEDLDFPKAISEQKKKQTLQEYALAMQRKRMQDDAKRMLGFF